MFVNCEKISPLWSSLKTCIANKTCIALPTDTVTIILVYQLFDSNYVALNTIILIAKKYIFHCFFKHYSPTINRLLKCLESMFIEQQLTSKVENNEIGFQKQ